MAQDHESPVLRYPYPPQGIQSSDVDPIELNLTSDIETRIGLADQSWIHPSATKDHYIQCESHMRHAVHRECMGICSMQ